MTDAFHLGEFLARWHSRARHDLSSSCCQELTVQSLLDLAAPTERAQWNRLELGYGAAHGSPALRAHIAALYAALDESNVVCCAGAQEAMACVAHGLLSAGDHAIIVLPIYQPLEWVVTDRVRATGVSLDPRDLSLDVAEVAAAIRPTTRLILMNFPNSPTGAVPDAATLAALVELCRAHGLWLVNDEVYRHPSPETPPVADLYERGVSVDALTKGLGLPGLRVGWVACQDRSMLNRIVRAKAMLSSCLAAPSEMLACIALSHRDALAARARRVSARNRDRLEEVLRRFPHLFQPDVGEGSTAFACPRYLGPEGADAFALRLLAATGTLVLPSNLWRSRLGPTPEDRLRIGLGRPNDDRGIEAIEIHLDVAAAA